MLKNTELRIFVRGRCVQIISDIEETPRVGENIRFKEGGEEVEYTVVHIIRDIPEDTANRSIVYCRVERY